MNAKETIGQKIHRLRMAAGLTQVQLADAAGAKLSTLQGWEIDRREPSMRAAVRLAAALRITVEELADTVPVEEVGKAPRPAGPSKPPAKEPEPKKTRKRKGK
jgi:transcriptional regulator with XRE-family HTH domain